MHVLFQNATSTAGSSGGTDWWKYALGALAPTIAFLGLLIAFFKYRKDLKNAETALNDRRFDERFDAKFGANFQNITKLMDLAKSLLTAAENSATTVREISVEAERINQTLQAQARQSDESRRKLDDALRRADQVIAQLDQTARKAEADSKVISDAREVVAGVGNSDLLRAVKNIGEEVGYRLTGGRLSGALTCSLQWPTERGEGHLRIDGVIVNPSRPEAAAPLIQQIGEARAADQPETRWAVSRNVIVTDLRFPSHLLDDFPEEVDIVPFDDFRRYLIELKNTPIDQLLDSN